MAFTYRRDKEGPLTYEEMDDNLEYVEALAQQSEAMSDSAGASAAQAATSAGLAADQVALAADQVGLAADQVGLAEGHAEQAQIYAAAAQSAAGVPSLAGNAGKILGVRQDEQGVEWQEQGTAATANVTESDLDVTAGRLLKVGDYGLGVSFITTALDCNDLVRHGFYYANDASLNKPTALGGMLYVSGGAGSATLKSQLFVTRDGSAVYQRVLDAFGTFTPWRKFLDTANWYLGTDKQHTVAAATGTVTLDLAAASTFDLTLTDNVTLAVSNAVVPAGETRSVVVRIRQGATARTLTWWPGITWLALTTPAAPAVDKIKEYVLSYDGSSWLGREGASN